MAMTNTQRTVLGNVKRGLSYHAGVSSHIAADNVYLWLVSNGYIRDGRITPAGEAELAPAPTPPAAPITMEVVTLQFTDGTSATYSGAVQMGTTGKALKGVTMRHMPVPEGCTLETLRSIGGTPNG